MVVFKKTADRQNRKHGNLAVNNRKKFLRFQVNNTINITSYLMEMGKLLWDSLGKPLLSTITRSPQITRRC